MATIERVRVRPRRRPRKPVRRTLIAVHRWSALILGLVLVVQCTSGAILLYNAELFRAQHASFYRHTEGPAVIDADRAVALVRSADPGFDVGWVGSDAGVTVVGSSDFAAAYSIDPATGQLGERVSLSGGVLGWLVNLHDCAFGCLRFSGAVPIMNEQAPLIDITWAATVLVVLGLLLVVLAVSGAIVWWPTVKRLRHGFRIRWRKGRFARDRDLHDVIGIVSVPFLLMWGITGITIEWPAAKSVVLSAFGGDAKVDLAEAAYLPHPTARPRPVGIGEAGAIALREAPGRLSYVMLPTEATPYYLASVAGAYSPYEHRAFYNGDVLVYINATDGSDTKVVDASHGRPLANTFYAKVFEPAHFGWLVNGWWRVLWLIFGLTPLLLAGTGLSTWLFRRGVQRERRRSVKKGTTVSLQQ